jgi:hypothetical protein
MFYLLLGAVLALFLWRGRKPWFKGDGWRIAAGAMAIAAFSGAAFTFIRGAWGTGIVLSVIGLWTASTARVRPAGPKRSATRIEPGLAEARSILGVGPSASREEILAAYGRLIRRAHPDAGGTEGLAAQLNAARDRLLRKA